MSKPLTENLFADTWTSSREGFPVNPTQAQGSDSERTTNATCGLKCVASYQRLPRPTLWAKMFAACLIGTGGWSSRRCVLTWKLWGTRYGRASFQLRVLALPIEETAFGLLPTVKTFDANGQRQLDANGQNVSNTTGRKYGVHLVQMAASQMLPTPNAFDWNTARSEKAHAKAKQQYGNALQDTLRQRAGQGFQLNPRFVAEMMGFPVNWTELPFQNGEQNPLKPTETP